MCFSRLLFTVLAVITAPVWGKDGAEAEAVFLKEAQRQAADAKKVFAKAAYCVAHVLKEGRSVLDPKNGLNREVLQNRTVEKKRLVVGAGRAVVEAALGRKGRYSVRDCYEPHHVFVFYTAEAVPVAVVELCLTCNRIRIAPGEVNTRDLYGDHETADLNALAKVLEEAGLPLTPFKSLEEYRAR
ncbi:MAG TPA: hypothetical protein VGE29_13775 [Prosthecobacter sp.]